MYLNHKNTNCHLGWHHLRSHPNIPSKCSAKKASGTWRNHCSTVSPRKALQKTSKFCFHFIVIDDRKGKLKSQILKFQNTMHHLGSSRKSNIVIWQTFMPDLSVMTREMETFHASQTPARSLWKSYISKCHDIFGSQHLIMTVLHLSKPGGELLSKYYFQVR